MTRIIHQIDELRAALAGTDVAFVPTMGALHEGHLSLVRLAAARAETVVVSVFVNPLQFGAGEDYDRYPRTLEADAALLETEGVAFVFAPSADEMYPDGDHTASATTVHAGPAGDHFEGAARAGHFDGMLTVVLKLFNIVQPRVAVFGQKDAQQLALVRQMVQDFNLPIEILAGPISREPDGLARSSRNRYLSPAERAAAATISRALEAANAARDNGVESVLQAAQTVLAAEPLLTPEYLAVVDPNTFEPLTAEAEGNALLITAVRVGTTRLLDNRALLITRNPGTPLAR